MVMKVSTLSHTNFTLGCLGKGVVSKESSVFCPVCVRACRLVQKREEEGGRRVGHISPSVSGFGHSHATFSFSRMFIP